MRHIAWIVMVATAVVAIAASCVPDFTFKKAPSGEDDGGVPQAMVPCGIGQWHVDCPAGEYCCYHELYIDCDTCTEEGLCKGPLCGGATEYRIRRCNGLDDCPANQQCCEEPAGDTACYPACNAAQKVICRTDEDCPPEQPTCVDEDPPYPGYMICGP